MIKKVAKKTKDKPEKKTKKTGKKYLSLKWILLFIAVFTLGATAGFLSFKTLQEDRVSLQQEAGSSQGGNYLGFLSEAYDKIKENYWKNLTDAELTNLFKLGSERLIGIQYLLESNDKKGLESMLAKILKELPADKKKEFSIKLISLILTNLEPFNRSNLYTQKEEESLKNRVENVNPETDLHGTLGVGKDASEDEIKAAFQEKIAELDLEKDKEELKEINYAFGVLSTPHEKERYEQSGAEPTVFSKLVHPDIFHIYIKKFSPTTFEEFQLATAKIDADKEKGPYTLILDLRDNIGGSIDILPYFLGPFIGDGQYAYETFHQGEHTPYKTKTGWLPSLVRYKAVVVLINENAQSTAELMAATLKKYNVGILVGRATKGWGTIEKVFKLDNQIDSEEKYSMFLVHSLTLRDDNQPIEGRGVAPVININDSDWQEQLFTYFHYQKLVEKVEEIWQTSPGDFY